MAHVCSQCGTALKDGVFSSNHPLQPSRIALINLWSAEPISSACNKCGDEVFVEATRELESELNELRNDLKPLIASVPVLSLQSPQEWTFAPIGIVTAQSVTGTGIFSDVASAFTDLFGSQSGSYNAKLREGENLCKASLRAQAIEQGGNAVLAVDVDYAEVGGTRAMLMVCMTGTVVRVSVCNGTLSDALPSLDKAHGMAVRARRIQSLFDRVARDSGG